MCDSIYPLHQELPDLRVKPKVSAQKEGATIYLRVPSVDSDVFRHIKLVMTMFEGDTPLKIRVADTGKLLGAKCLNHPAFIEECEEWLGKENVVVK